MAMAGLTPAHLLLILFIALIVVGPGKLPEVGAAIGKSVREFQKATGQAQETLTGSTAPQQALLLPPAQQLPGGAMPPAQSAYAAQSMIQQPLPYQVPSPAALPGVPGPGYPAQPGTLAQAPQHPESSFSAGPGTAEHAESTQD
jgi:TatA/E family protein of Tat protein translocase